MADKDQALNYTGPSLGNQVDGLPSARHGVFGPAAIHDKAPNNAN